MRREFKETNHLAILGFLLPFVAAAVTGALLLIVREDLRSLEFLLPYFVVVPAILLGSLVSSIKSIPHIPNKGDKDYAYSGLTLSILSLVVYITSIIYFVFFPPNR